ncbi:unnamed protein product, partial [Chrysoparadoxa australica]
LREARIRIESIISMFDSWGAYVFENDSSPESGTLDELADWKQESGIPMQYDSYKIQLQPSSSKERGGLNPLRFTRLALLRNVMLSGELEPDRFMLAFPAAGIPSLNFFFSLGALAPPFQDADFVILFDIDSH